MTVHHEIATVEDLERILDEHPEIRERIRRKLLTDEERALPGIVAQLAEELRRLTQVVTEGFAQVHRELDELRSGQQGLLERQQRLEEGQQGLVEGQQGLLERQQRLEEGQQGLVEGQQGLLERQERLEEGQQSLVEGQQGLLERQERLEEGQQGLLERQERLEEGQQGLVEGQQGLLERQERLEEGQQGLVEGQQGLLERQERLEEGQQGLVEGQQGLLERQERLEEGQQGLVEGQQGLLERQQRLEERQQQFHESLENLRGTVLEQTAARRLLPRITQELRLRRPQIIKSLDMAMPVTLLDALDKAAEEDRITIDMAAAVAVTDLIMQGVSRDDATPVYVLAEISGTLNHHDIARAQERAAALETATGQRTLAAVAAVVIPEAQRGRAAAAGVSTYLLS